MQAAKIPCRTRYTLGPVIRDNANTGIPLQRVRLGKLIFIEKDVVYISGHHVLKAAH